jgi:hypothetical protein
MRTSVRDIANLRKSAFICGYVDARIWRVSAQFVVSSIGSLLISYLSFLMRFVRLSCLAGCMPIVLATYNAHLSSRKGHCTHYMVSPAPKTLMVNSPS